MDAREFGKYLKQLREQKDISIRQLSHISGVSYAYISQLENGNRGIPKPEILEKLAPHLNIEYEAFMERAGYIDLDKIKKSDEPKLTLKDERDIEKKLQDTMKYIDEQEGLVLGDFPLEESEKLLLKQAIEIGLKYAKINARNKFTPNSSKK